MTNSFEQFNLNHQLLNALNDMKIDTPTPIQEKVFNVAMSGEDICGIAQTGTGKTLAYLLPTLRQWKFTKEKNPQILIIVPTRELVVQVVNVVKDLATYMSLDVIGVYGGIGMNTHREVLRNGTDIIVGTPGRLFDLLMVKAFKTKEIKKLIIDEADEMLSLGFKFQLKSILDVLPAKRQNLMFSATMDSEVEQIIVEYFGYTVRVQASAVGMPAETIAQFVFKVPNFYTKINLLHYLLKNNEAMTKVLIFAPSKKLVDLVYKEIAYLHENEIALIHSNKEQTHRFRVVKQFEDGEIRILVATDLVARGIDVSKVSHVINFDTPDIAENYVHRIGRTGRAEQKGTSLTFCTEKEEVFLDAIETFIESKIEVLELPAALQISEELLYSEQPQKSTKELNATLPKKVVALPAFHDKAEKNKKVNNKISRKDKMMAKYGKAITRGSKKK